MENDFVVTVSDAEVSCKRPNGVVESVEWDDLKAVVIETTNEGPFVTDVYWLLIGTQSGCLIPQGAIGEDALIKKLQTLPGFDNDALIEA